MIVSFAQYMIQKSADANYYQCIIFLSCFFVASHEARQRDEFLLRALAGHLSLLSLAVSFFSAFKARILVIV
ncbi:hypothetical protein VNO80_23941 [Phaseolus coccineus]|uniref:Uncharacterized protein n=1 Tax=Phaseolus coccineus TaxID=3886 RepID=A0AAN9LWE3_PHACN